MPTQTVPLFPLSQGLFPDGRLRLTIFEVRYLHLMRRCQQEGIEFGVVPLAAGAEVQKAGHLERLFEWGCMAKLVSASELQPAVLSVTCIGTERFRLGAHDRGAYGLWSGEIARIPADPICAIPTGLQPVADQLGKLIASAQREGLEEKLPFGPPYDLENAGWVANRWADILPLPATEKIALLAQTDPVARLESVSGWL
jgi:Lon protease-like protein